MRTRSATGELCEVRDDEVDSLETLIADLQVPSIVLDDAVHDCCDATASRRLNSDETLPGDIEQAHDVAYGEASAHGSAANNGGPRSQAAFLLTALSLAEAEAAVRSLADRVGR